MARPSTRRLSPERLRITRGRVGPLLAPCTIEAKPFTVFIGTQGTGKSLAAQLLYFFNDIGRLVPLAEAAVAPEEGAVEEKRTTGQVIEDVLDGLRSTRGYFSSFLEHGTSIEYEPPQALPGGRKLESFSVRITEVKKKIVKIVPDPRLALRVERARRVGSRKWTRAIFVPTERILYSELTAPMLRVYSGPMTFTLFAEEMDAARETLDKWGAGKPDTKEGIVVQELARDHLGGEVTRDRAAWKWRISRENRRGQLLNIDMASSGQKANWPLILLAEVLFSWRREGRIAAGTTIYVEEPEIHLHPAAQRMLIEVLAMLVRNGFRVIVTTHSLTVLYTVNNLVQAGRLPKKTRDEKLPPHAVRLGPDEVEAILFKRDGTAQSLVNPENGFINEAELGLVTADLQDQMNRITYLLDE